MNSAGVRRLRLLAPLVPFIVAAAVVTLKLPQSSQYAGTDPGFSLTETFGHILTQTWFAWSWYGIGSVNFYNFLVMPFYALLGPLNANFGAAAVSHILETVEFGGLGLGAYMLSMQVAGGDRPADVARSLAIALFAMFGTLGALLLLVPASLFQPAFALWPILLAWEMRLLRERRRAIEVVAYALLMYFALSCNLAHSVVGLALSLLVAARSCAESRSFGRASRIAAIAGSIVTLLTMPLWLPVLVYHFSGASPIFFNSNLARPDDLVYHAAASASQSSLAALLQFNTIVWWKDLDQAKAFANPFITISTFALAALALLGLCNGAYAASLRRFWGVLWLLALFLAKGMHAPFGSYYAHFLTLPMASLFREANDKFLLAVYITTVALAAFGLSRIRVTPARIVVGIALLCSAIPFFSGSPLLEPFVTRVPADYAKVASIIGSDAYGRVLSIAPSNINEQGSLYWYRGSNLDEALLTNPVTYSYAFQVLGLSETPAFNDDRMTAAAEFFAERQAGRILGIRYILVHKDFTQSFDIGFAQNGDQLVNGPRIAQAVLAQCELDPGLERLFDGRYLALYRVRTVDAVVGSVDRLHAVRGYGNALFSLLETAPGSRGFVFSGTQPGGGVTALPPALYTDEIDTFVQPPAAGMTTDQQLSAPDRNDAISSLFAALPVSHTLVAALPPGDLVDGIQPPGDWGLRFVLPDARVRPLSAFYRHRSGYSAWDANDVPLVAPVPSPSARAFGLLGAAANTLSSPTAVAASISPNIPIAGDLHAFIAIAGSQQTVGDSGVLGLRLAGSDGEFDVYVNLGFDIHGKQPDPKSLAGVLSYARAPRIVSVNVDIPSALAAVRAVDPSAGQPYEPGLRIVRATLVLNTQPDEHDSLPTLAAFRLYDKTPDDYEAQQLTANEAMPALSISDASNAVTASIDRPQAARELSATPSNGSVVLADYRFRSWTPGTLVLSTDAFVQQGGGYTADIVFTYRGERYRLDDVPLDTPQEAPPWGVMPFDISIAHPVKPVFLEWNRVTLDLRPVLPDLQRSRVERVVVKFTMGQLTPARSMFVFGPLEGFRNDPKAFPLTPLQLNGRTLPPLRILRAGANATVNFPSLVPLPGRPMDFTTKVELSNVPHVVRIGPAINATHTVSNGIMVDPTLTTIALSAPGVIELGTTYNQGWTLRAGSVSAGNALLPELAAWMSTRPQDAPHFVADGFANAWNVPPGKYTLVFFPQVVRDFSVLLMIALAAIGLLAWVGVAAFFRIARARKEAA
jgi:hypothetical protein